MSDLEQYARYFSVGMRVGVGIPMHDNELFRDWAVIQGMEKDLAELQLSRDVLPADVDMQTGKVLELRCGKEGKGYRCSGIFISEGEAGIIHIRLSGEVNSFELREYFRIEAFLPIKIQAANDHNLDAVLKEWRTRKQNRLAAETELREEMELKRRERLRKAVEAGLSDEERNREEVAEQQAEGFDLTDDSWDDVIAVPVNLSAGGFKFVTADPYELGDLVFLEVLIPTRPPRIMDSVARVVFKNRNNYAGSDQEYWNVATQFMFIDERDRDAIVSHIANLELMRIRMLRQNRLPSDTVATSGMFTPFRVVSAAVILFALLMAITVYFLSYTHSNIRNEIQDTFESGIRKYMERLK